MSLLAVKYTFTNPDIPGLPSDLANSGKSLDKYISTLLGFATAVAFIYFVFQFIVAGFGFLSSEGDKAKIELARHRMSQSLLGLIIIVSAIFLSALIGRVLGLGDILNLESILSRIKI